MVEATGGGEKDKGRVGSSTAEVASVEGRGEKAKRGDEVVKVAKVEVVKAAKW